LEPAPWPNRFGDFREQNGDSRQFLALSGEFPGENGQDFTDDWPGNEEMIPTCNYPKNGFLRLFPGKTNAETKMLLSKTTLTFQDNAEDPAR
jgi:hypothetical protein